MSKESLRISLGSVAISLEAAETLEDVKNVLSDLISAIDDELCEVGEEGEER